MHIADSRAVFAAPPPPSRPPSITDRSCLEVERSGGAPIADWGEIVKLASFSPLEFSYLVQK